MNEYTFNIDPVAAPRMSQRDKWKPSKAASKYFAFRDNLCYLAYLQGLYGLPDTIDAIQFEIPMPVSWSNRKKEEMNSSLHQQTPDLDNLLKALLDTLCPTDQHVCSIGKLSKVWGETGSIKISLNGEGSSPIQTNIEFSKELNT